MLKRDETLFINRSKDDMKKGQVTIFIIVSIIVVGIILLFLFLFNNKKNFEEPVDIEVGLVKDFVQDCFEKTSKQALYFIGLYGGYYIPPEQSTEFGVPYYVYNSQSRIPSKDKIESEISRFVEESLPLCLGEFESFSEFKIEKGNPKVITEIWQDSVFIELDYPIRISQGKTVSLLEEFENKIPIRLDTIYEACEFILDYELENPGEICLNCLLNLEAEKQIQINMQSMNTTIVYEIVDEESTLNVVEIEGFEPENYKFRFAIKY